MDEYIIPLEAVSQTDVVRVGAKAAALGRLLEAGFPVPRGLCVTTTAFRLALGPRLDQINTIIHQHDLLDPSSAATASTIIDGLLANLTVPTSVIMALREAVPTFANPTIPLAVRSSATAEDSAEASFAGQYESVIGVRGEDALHAAIVTVWRSFFGTSALAARAAQDALSGDEAMAVLILPVVDSECAGVAFSVDPVHSRRDRIVVTAAWGLGAGVVDGSVATDTTWVRREGIADGFEIEERRVVEKAQQIGLDPDSNGSLKRLVVPDNRRRAACLPESWAQRVAQFCVAAEVLFGYPQDLEWAIADGQVWVLQSRPITALPPELTHTPSFPVSWKDKNEQSLAWVHYPYWRHVLKPLEMDYAHDREAASKEAATFTGGARFQRVKIVNGHTYTCWAPSDLPDGDRRVRRAALADLAARLRSQSMTTWDYWGPEVVQATRRLSAFDPDGADGYKLAEHLEDAWGAMRRHLAIHGSRLHIPRRPLYAAWTAVSGQTGPEVEETVDKLLEGEETPSTRLIDRLFALASSAREIPTVAALVTDPPPDVMDRLAALPEAAAFRDQLEDFQAAFGDCSGAGYGSDGTIDMPTWREDPLLVLRCVAPYLDPTVEPPAFARARARREREEQIEALCSACDDEDAVAVFRRELAYWRRQAAVMEEHNHYIDQLMNGQLRRAVLAAARWLVAQGALTTVEQVFWLHIDEILEALRAAAPKSCAAVFGNLIAARQEQHAEWEKLKPPPLLGIPDERLPERTRLQDEVTQVAYQSTDHVRGLAASPGLRQGRARVVPSSVFLPDLSPGEVLVAENVGPRWTPLIPMLAGLVLDGGAVGQHHAIMAREYGVPAVVCTGNATRRIPNGAWVSVNGTAGIVEIDVSPDKPA